MEGGHQADLASYRGLSGHVVEDVSRSAEVLEPHKDWEADDNQVGQIGDSKAPHEELSLEVDTGVAEAQQVI